MKCEVRGVRLSDGKQVCIRGSAASLAAAIRAVSSRGVSVTSAIDISEAAAPEADGGVEALAAPLGRHNHWANFGYGALVVALVLGTVSLLAEPWRSRANAATSSQGEPRAASTSARLASADQPREAAATPPPAPPTAPAVPAAAPTPRTAPTLTPRLPLEPGYEWTGTGANAAQVWRAGKRHPQFQHITSTATEGQWVADPGYTFPEQGSLRVQWTPGRRHPEHRHVLSGPQPGDWQAEPGYAWVDPKDANDLSVRWNAGSRHPSTANVVAGPDEGKWRAAPGYRFANEDPNDMSVVRAGPTRQQIDQAVERILEAFVAHGLGSGLNELLEGLGDQLLRERNQKVRDAVANLLPGQPAATRAVTDVLVMAFDGRLDRRNWMSSAGRQWLVETLRAQDPDMADAYQIAELLGTLLSLLGK